MKPIIFSTEMVRAILDGRKTQTRRVIKPQPPEGVSVVYGPEYCRGRSGIEIYGIHGEGWERKCPYRPHQILWVRETWQHNPCRGSGWPYDYKATPEHNNYEHDTWRPSIHMPREAARIFLLVKAVRAERLQGIAEADATAEGAETDQYLEFLEWATSVAPGGSRIETVRDNFMHIWNRLNARRGYGWDTNPWVWVVEFERTEAPS